MKNICYYILIISLIFLLFNLLNCLPINQKEGLDTSSNTLSNTLSSTTTPLPLLTPSTMTSTSSYNPVSTPYPPSPLPSSSDSTKCNIIGSKSWNYLCQNGLASTDAECQTNCATTSGPGPKVCCTTPCCTSPPTPYPPPRPSKCFNKGAVQCGGSVFTKDKKYRCCPDGSTCSYQSKWYSECRADA